MLKRISYLAAVLATASLIAACTPASGPQGHIDLLFGATAGQATKVAQCESNMNPGAVSPTHDHGLFQINAVHRGQFESVTGQAWSRVYDSYWNTMYAQWLYDRQGWSPWSCSRVL